MSLDFMKLDVVADPEPSCDWGHCESCDFDGPLAGLDSDWDGEFVDGHQISSYLVYHCPVCKDSYGSIECDMSEPQAELWFSWHDRKGEG